MNSNTKTLLFTILLLGTVLSLFAATTVIASTRNVLSGQRQCDQDREQLNKHNNSSLDDGRCERHQYQHSSECLDCDNMPAMNQMQYRYQHRHCWTQGN
jgi:hypothetical protein